MTVGCCVDQNLAFLSFLFIKFEHRKSSVLLFWSSRHFPKNRNFIRKFHRKISRENFRGKFHRQISYEYVIGKFHTKITQENCIRKFHRKISKFHRKISQENFIGNFLAKYFLTENFPNLIQTVMSNRNLPWSSLLKSFFDKKK